MTKKITVAIVEDHGLVRRGIHQLLKTYESCGDIFEFDNVQDAITALNNRIFDVVIVDLSFKQDSGFNVINQATETDQPTKYIVYSMHDSEPYVSEALNAGASAYVSKRSVADDILIALDAVLSGKLFVSSDVKANIEELKTKQSEYNFNDLTEKEVTVFKLLAIGMPIKKIAVELDISDSTVHVHRRNLMQKLNIRDDRATRQLALSLGVISSEELS